MLVWKIMELYIGGSGCLNTGLKWSVVVFAGGDWEKSVFGVEVVSKVGDVVMLSSCRRWWAELQVLVLNGKDWKKSLNCANRRLGLVVAMTVRWWYRWDKKDGLLDFYLSWTEDVGSKDYCE